MVHFVICFAKGKVVKNWLFKYVGRGMGGGRGTGFVHPNLLLYKNLLFYSPYPTCTIILLIIVMTIMALRRSFV